MHLRLNYETDMTEWEHLYDGTSVIGEVYLYQNSQEIQLKMLDNGVGFDLNASTDEMSYGLKNIQERVDEMAGTVQFLSAKGKGTSIDVRVPILRGEDNVE